MKKSKSKSHWYSSKEEKPEPKKKSTFSKLADEIKQTVKPKDYPPKVEKKEKCLCCEAGCTCCEHKSGTVGHRCLCRCHA